MDTNSPTPCPNTVTICRNPHRKARATPASAPTKCLSYPDLPEISVFPREEILSAGPENPPLEPSSKPIGESKNIKVFLRIRPISASKGSGKVSSIAGSKAKTAWPQNPAKKNAVAGEKNAKRKSSTICVIVNDSQTVTLSPPIDLQDSKRIKSETYGGYSHVYFSDSSQVDVYERMVKPIVDDFINGTSGMLAALRPSGSGKTHTVFGCPREPGMVPLALRQILKGNQSSWSFYISMFEISSERAKVEKLFDLLADGAEISMQQSNVKGLKECEGVSAQPSHAVLTIIDLAGAERVKKTRNQAANNCDLEPVAYEFFTQAFVLYEEEIAESKALVTVIHLIIGTLQRMNVFGVENRDTSTHKATGCRAVYACSYLFWVDDPDGIKDGERVLLCLKRALRIANAAQQMANVTSGSSGPVTLFVEILNKYLYYFEKGNPQITNATIQSLIELIKTEMEGDSSSTLPASDAFFAGTLRYIQFQKQKGGLLGQKYDSIEV